MKPSDSIKVTRRTNTFSAIALLISLAFSVIARGEPSTNKWPSLAEIRKKWDDVAVDKVKQAAESGDLTAQHYLGYIFATGQRVAANGTESVTWYERAVGGGYLPSGNNLGLLYWQGGVVTQDVAKAIYYARLAADKGQNSALSILVGIYNDGPGAPRDYKEALQWFQSAAAQGHSVAMLGLYLSYKYGRGVPENETEATNWLVKAAEAGNALAQCQLGGDFEHMDWDRFHEVSYFRDMRDAVPWYRRSADQGWPPGQYWLGLCYLEGKGVDWDEEKGVELIRKAADEADSRALIKLAELYQKGIGEPRDENDRPINLLLRAAKIGLLQAYYPLVKCYQDGTGVPRDLIKAAYWCFRWYSDPAQAATGARSLKNQIHDSAFAGNVDPFTAAQSLYLKATLLNNAAAMAALGDLYVTGRNVPQDPLEAWAWFRLAADQGSSSGSNRLSQVEVKMPPQQIESAKQRVNELKDWAQKIEAALKYLGD